MYAKTRARGACVGPVLRDPAPTFRAGVRVPVTTRSLGLGSRVSIPLGIGAAWVTVFGGHHLVISYHSVIRINWVAIVFMCRID